MLVHFPYIDIKHFHSKINNGQICFSSLQIKTKRNEMERRKKTKNQSNVDFLHDVFTLTWLFILPFILMH